MFFLVELARSMEPSTSCVPYPIVVDREDLNGWIL